MINVNKRRGYVDLTGKVKGKLTVLRRIGFDQEKQQVYWLCRCACGNEVKVSTSAVNIAVSCGCARRRAGGMWKSVEFQCWWSMIKRCTTSKQEKDVKNYQNRNIKVCDRWMESFLNFYADMGPRPSNKHSIERRLNDGNYEPSNCFWADDFQQVNNRRTTIMIEYQGKTQSLSRWCIELGLDRKLMKGRYRMGMTPEKMFTAPRQLKSPRK